MFILNLVIKSRTFAGQSMGQTIGQLTGQCPKKVKNEIIALF